MVDRSHRSILIKISGEALKGKGGNSFPFNPDILTPLVADLVDLNKRSFQIALVVGGGNIYRGHQNMDPHAIDRVTGDQIGMLATVINALVLQDQLRKAQQRVRVMTARAFEGLAETYCPIKGVHALEQGEILLLAGGTGNLFFTTDTAAALRASELRIELLLKGTKVDGVYSQDPVTHPEATHYPQLSFEKVIAEDLKVMDKTAFYLCQTHQIPICVFNLFKKGALVRAACGEEEGTLISG